MTAIQAITLFSFAMFSLVDLRVRVVPLIEVFFGVAVFLAFPDDRLHVTVLILAVKSPSRPSLPVTSTISFSKGCA